MSDINFELVIKFLLLPKEAQDEIINNIKKLVHFIIDYVKKIEVL